MTQAILIRTCIEKNITISAAESCTGGQFIASLIEIPGSSSVIEAAFVTYANDAKIRYAHVDPAALQRHGAVSEVVAKQMAEGVALEAGAVLGVGITGIAGPSGGTPEKPVGTVWIAVHYQATTTTQAFFFMGDRPGIQRQSVQAACDMMLQVIR